MRWLCFRILILTRALPLGNGRLAPHQNSEEPPCQIPDPSGCFGINAVLKDGQQPEKWK